MCCGNSQPRNKGIDLMAPVFSQFQPIRMDEDYITRNLLNTKEKLPEGADGMSFRQLSLFDDMGIE